MKTSETKFESYDATTSRFDKLSRNQIVTVAPLVFYTKGNRPTNEMSGNLHSDKPPPPILVSKNRHLAIFCLRKFSVAP